MLLADAVRGAIHRRFETAARTGDWRPQLSRSLPRGPSTAFIRFAAFSLACALLARHDDHEPVKIPVSREPTRGCTLLPRLSPRDGKGSAGFHVLQQEIPMRRQLFSLPHLSPILLLSVLVLWVPLASAQATRPISISIELSKPAGSPAAIHQAKVCLFTSYGKPPLNFPPDLSQPQSEPRLLRGSGYQLLLPTNRPVLELAGKPNYLIANAPKEWLTNPPSNVDYQTFDSHDLKYYGGRTPLVGGAILRIAQQADSHPRITRLLLMIDPQF